MLPVILLILKRGLKVGLITGVSTILASLIDPHILIKLPPNIYATLTIILPILSSIVAMAEKALTELLKGVSNG